MQQAVPQETPAERMYRKHLLNVSKYQKANKEKVGKKQKDYLEKIKEVPEKYKELQQKRHEYYMKNKKPKTPPVEEAIEGEPVDEGAILRRQDLRNRRMSFQPPVI